MAKINYFGPSASFNFPLVDPRCIREHRGRFRRDLFPELELANSYYSMAGRWPDVGWLLLDRDSYNKIAGTSNAGAYSSTLQLTIGDFVNAPLTISNLSIVQARCVTRGLPSDANAIYLVQVTNNEGVLYNPWFQFPVNAQYNVESPAYDGSFYLDTTDAGTDWTWDSMVGDLWGKASSLLGTYPGLPITPTGTPEGFIFVGIPLWEAISEIMEYLGLAVSGNFPAFSIVVPGAADAAYSALVAKYSKYLEDSMDYLDQGSGRVPSSVIVYFHTRYKVYGKEETVRKDAQQWQTLQPHSITVSSPSSFLNATGTGYLWSDFMVRLDHNGDPLAADLVEAQSIAAERATQFFNTIYRGTQGFSRQVYSGVLPFTTGSLVDGVRWFNTGLLGKSDDPWCGWRTEVIRGYLWEEVTFPLTLRGLTGPT